MKTKHKFIFLIAFALVLHGCKKDKEEIHETPPGVTEDTPLSDATEAAIAATPDTLFRLEDIILDNGQDVRTFLEENDPQFLLDYPSGRSAAANMTPQQQKNLFLARMLAMGNHLVDDSKHTYPDEGPGKPAQTGLAYSWGSRDHEHRQAPPGATGDCKDIQVYGLDCSGMLWKMTQKAHVQPEPVYNFFVSYLTDANKWTNAFRNSADYKDLKMQDKGMLPISNIQDGDIIMWVGPNGDHVGVYLKGYLYQSNGRSKKQACYNNRNQDKGPRCVTLANVMSWGLGTYKVLRASYTMDYKLVAKTEYSYSGTYGGCQVWDYSDSSYVIFHIDTVEVNFVRPVITDAVFHYPSLFTPAPAANCTCNSLSYPIGQSHIDSLGGFYSDLLGNQLTLDVYIKEGSPAYSSECNGTPDNGSGSFTMQNYALYFNIVDSVQDAGAFILYKLR